MINSVRCIVLILMLGTVSAEAQSVRDDVTQCKACHGERGISPQKEWPNLAGQQVGYLIAQMKAFRDGDRSDPLMAGALDDLSDERLEEIAEFFNRLPSAAPQQKSLDTAGMNVRARCISCHTTTGVSVTTYWPNIAGQQSSYLRKQLADYKSGVRKTLPMAIIAAELSDQQIADVAEYYSQK